MLPVRLKRLGERYSTRGSTTRVLSLLIRGLPSTLLLIDHKGHIDHMDHRLVNKSLDHPQTHFLDWLVQSVVVEIGKCLCVDTLFFIYFVRFWSLVWTLYQATFELYIWCSFHGPTCLCCTLCIWFPYDYSYMMTYILMTHVMIYMMFLMFLWCILTCFMWWMFTCDAMLWWCTMHLCMMWFIGLWRWIRCDVDIMLLFHVFVWWMDRFYEM